MRAAEKQVVSSGLVRVKDEGENTLGSKSLDVGYPIAPPPFFFSLCNWCDGLVLRSLGTWWHTFETSSLFL